MANNDLSFGTDGRPSAPYTPPTLDRGGGVRQVVHALANAAGTVVNPATSEGIAGLATALASILTAIQAQRAETIWTDDTGTRFIRVDIGGAIVWTDVAGNAASPPGTGARPDNDSGSAVSRQSFKATASGTGYSSGDYLDHFLVSDESGDPVGNFWINLSTGAKITAPSSANITMVSALPEGAATDAKVEAVRALLAGTLTVLGAAGENHLGAVGGESKHVSAVPTLTAQTYASGKCLGGLLTLTGILRAANKSAILQSASLRAKGANAVPVDLVVFRDVPTVTTGLVDNATFAIDPADFDKVAKVVTFGVWNSLGTPSLATVDGIGKLLGAAGTATDLRAILVARGSVVIGSTSDLSLGLGVLQD